MGGQYTSVGMNEAFASDFNFHLDAEAAHIILRVKNT